MREMQPDCLLVNTDCPDEEEKSTREEISTEQCYAIST
jgi:hypothetical protein